MRKPSKILLLVLLLLMGSTSYADARSGHGGRHGGFHRGGHGGFRGGGARHHHFVPHHRSGHVHRFYPHFHGGIVFDVSPLWIAPAPYIGVTPAPPTPAGTCVALLHRPTRLLSYSTRVHGALDPGSAFWIAA